MKRFALCLIALVLVAPSSARAAEPAACLIEPSGGDPGEEYGRLGTQAHPIAGEIAAWLGEQAGGFWLQPRDGNWYLGVAPGPVAVEEVRGRALEMVDARHDGEDEQRLRDRLRVLEQPYGHPELLRIRDELANRAGERRWGASFVVAVSCQHSDTWRVELELYSDASERIAADARELAAAYGDRVRVVHLAGTPPPVPQSLGRSYVTDYVRVRGCRVTLRPAVRRQVRSLRVRRVSRRVARVRIRLKVGGTLRGTVRLRSCASS